MTPETMDDNIVLAPFWVASGAGSCKYERYNPSSPGNQDQLNDADDNINAWLGFNGFTATHGTLIQWTDAVSAEDSDDKNTFQAFAVTDGTQSYVVFNYEKIDYSSSIGGEDAAVGIFVNSEDSN